MAGKSTGVSRSVPPSPALRSEQRRLVEELLAGKDVTAACKAAGVGRTTAYRWMGQPAFQSALREADREVLTATSRRLARIGGKAVQVLLILMSDPETPPSARIRAADAVLGKALQLRETVDIEERLSALEAAAGQQEKTDHG